MSSKAEFDHAVGSLPTGWRSLHLGDVADISRGTSWGNENERREPVDGALPVLGIKNVQARLEIHDLVWLQGLKPSAISSSTVQAGDILMVGSNGNPARIGNAVQVDEPGCYLYASLLFGVRPRRDKVDPDFLYRAIGAPGVQAAISDAVQGTTGLSNLKITTLRDLRIDLPPLDEQRRIAEVLGSVDAAISANEVFYRQRDIIRKGLGSLLLRGLNHKNFKPSAIGEVPMSWSVKPMKDVCHSVGVGIASSATHAYVEKGVPLLRNQNIKRGHLDLRDLLFVNDEYDRSYATKRVRTGDVITMRTGYPGRSAVVPPGLDGCQTFTTLISRPNRDIIDPYFLCEWINSEVGMAEVKKRQAGGAQQNLNAGSMEEVPIPVPPLAEQKLIADIFLQFPTEDDVLIERLRSTRGLLQADLLSGRVRVQAVETKANVPAVQPAFKRAVFAAEIVRQLRTDKSFGSIKHEKIVHLCELHLSLQGDLDRHAYKEAAGPYDPKAMRSVEKIFQQQKWFRVIRSGRKRVEYVPLEKVGGHASYFDRYFGARKEAIQSIIDLMRPLNTERSEIVATLYAVWNDFLIDKMQPSDDQVVTAVLQWHPKKEKIPKGRWLAALPWMRKKGLVPKGTGEKTRVAQE